MGNEKHPSRNSSRLSVVIRKKEEDKHILDFLAHKKVNGVPKTMTPLVVTTIITNHSILGILINGERSCNIMYLYIFKKLRLHEQDLTWYGGRNLLAFNNSTNRPLGCRNTNFYQKWKGQKDRKHAFFGNPIQKCVQNGEQFCIIKDFIFHLKLKCQRFWRTIFILAYIYGALLIHETILNNLSTTPFSPEKKGKKTSGITNKMVDLYVGEDETFQDDELSSSSEVKAKDLRPVPDESFKVIHLDDNLKRSVCIWGRSSVHV